MLLLVALIVNALLVATVSTKECRCTPRDKCWPSLDDWDSLNNTVNGRLSIPESPVQPCLEDEKSESCHAALKRFGADPFWLELSPGATQSTGN